MEKTDFIPPYVAILIVVITFILLLFAGGLFYIFLGYAEAQILSELLVLVVPLGYMLYKKINIKRYIGLDAKPQRILLGIILGGIVFGCDVLISVLMTSIFGPNATIEEVNRTISDISTSAKGFVLLAAALALAGICEEFTFRGFLQTSINNKYPSWIALLASALAFGFFHLDPQGIYIISAFLIGLLFGYIYHHWHSYITSAVAHASVNIIVFAMILLATQL